FARHQMATNPMPQLKWKHSDADGKMWINVESSEAPKAARLWVATAPTPDFRQGKWSVQPAVVKENVVAGGVSPPSAGYLAFYADLDYEIDGIPYHLATQIRVMGNGKP